VKDAYRQFVAKNSEFQGQWALAARTRDQLSIDCDLELPIGLRIADCEDFRWPRVLAVYFDAKNTRISYAGLNNMSGNRDS
jgi:hypothetical protein